MGVGNITLETKCLFSAQRVPLPAAYEMTLQPILKYSDDQLQIIGLEALSTDKNRPGVSPESYLKDLSAREMFEHDCNIFEQACAFSSQNTPKVLLNTPYISVNLSAATLANPHLINTLASIMHEHRVSNEAINIEILEDSFPLADKGTILDNIRKINEEIGLRIMIDDYGTGASNGARIDELSEHIYAVKIDKSLLDVGHLQFLRYDTRLKGRKLIIEGVEFDWQLAHIQNNFDDRAAVQGYGFHKPLSKQEAMITLSSAPDYWLDNQSALTEQPVTSI